MHDRPQEHLAAAFRGSLEYTLAGKNIHEDTTRLLYAHPRVRNHAHHLCHDATSISGVNGDRGDREIFILSVQLTTTRIDSLTRLIHSLLHVMTIPTSFGFLSRTVPARS